MFDSVLNTSMKTNQKNFGFKQITYVKEKKTFNPLNDSVALIQRALMRYMIATMAFNGVNYQPC